MPRGKGKKMLQLIDACSEILAEIQPASVRAICYQLFIRGRLASMAKEETDKVSRELVYARKAGLIDWGWIVDETRAMEGPYTYQDPFAFVEATLDTYRRDHWASQAHRVEVWAEKGTIRPTLGAMLETYGVGFLATHGNLSWTKSHEAADSIRASDRPVVILYVGDHDASGRHMIEVDLPGRFAWEGVSPTLLSLALDPGYARREDLPSFPVKDTDTESQWFRAHYGDTCWELDAMNPNALRALVQTTIESYIDWDRWQQSEALEAEEQPPLHEALIGWGMAMQRRRTPPA